MQWPVVVAHMWRGGGGGGVLFPDSPILIDHPPMSQQYAMNAAVTEPDEPDVPDLSLVFWLILCLL